MRKGSKITACVLTVFCAALFSACGENLLAYDSFSHFGTQTRWVYAGGSGAEVWQKLTAAEEEIEESVSIVRAGSVARFNAAAAGEKVEIDQIAYEILTTARKIYDLSDGAYNPATGLLVDLWGFTPRFRAEYSPATPYDREEPWKELPSAEYIEAFRSLADFSAVALFEEEGKYYAQKPDISVTLEGITYTVQLDLSGIGKGYCVDEAAKILRDANVTDGYFNLGGSGMCVLKNPNDDKGEWEIEVVHPRNTSDSYMTLRAENTCLSTSGDYESYYEIDGVRYCHIIDPVTGYPVGTSPDSKEGRIICATVVGLSGAEGDAVTTALLAMGRDRAIEFIRSNLKDVRASFVYFDGSTYTVYANSQETVTENWAVERI